MSQDRQNGGQAARPDATGLEIAIIAMEGRFPGASGIGELWENLCQGKESIARFSIAELEASGIERSQYEKPNYVPARAPIEGADLFDADFFDYNPREAELLDPQQRIFLECAQQALEKAGCDPSSSRQRIGVFAGSSMSSYLIFNLLSNRRILASAGDFQALLANDKDYLATRTSYKLNLRGPSLVVQSACSSSLAAVHVACQSLLNGECEMALAGGVSVSFPQRRGYLYQDGAIFSPDGHCRPFDRRAQGTVNGDGAGLVVLKRLEDALSSGDAIEAVILGSAVNNDGWSKVGFTAPSAEGQAAVISAAQLMAEVEAGSFGYVEGHGTATPLGDPIEISALSEAFRATTSRRGFCALGSIKGNFGHLDAAAGVAGLIKAALVLKHAKIPPSPHFEEPNREAPLKETPFFVNRELQDWSGPTPRRAAVSSFGIGGTNAHMVLEEAPARAPSSASRPYQLLLVSARTAPALQQASSNLAQALAPQGKPLASRDLADAAFTLNQGRRSFEHRRALVCERAEEAVEMLQGPSSSGIWQGVHGAAPPPVAFLFPGQGSQYAGMARHLYDSEAAFRKRLDCCAAELLPSLGVDPLEALWPSAPAEDQLRQTALAQPLLFSVEYSLARLWMEWGLEPSAMIGHSVGEYVAACLAGVWTLPDALRLVSARGRLMQGMAPGGMLSVQLPASDVEPRLKPGLELAAVNAPCLCTVAGAPEALKAFRKALVADNVQCRPLHTSHAFHSASMEPMLQAFRAELQQVEMQVPRLRFLSNRSGDWIRPEQAVSVDYWLGQLRHPVQFSSGVAKLLEEPEMVLLEVGPGRTLSTLAKQQPSWSPQRPVLTSMPHAQDQTPSSRFALQTLGRLWLCGIQPRWEAFYSGERRRTAELPTYPFQRQSFWVEPQLLAFSPEAPAEAERRPSQQPPDEGTEHQRPAMSVPYAAPGDEVERRLAAIWQELLGIGQIGVQDDFFELGGHSLLATQVLSRVQEEYGCQVPLQQLMQAPTIEELAGWLRRRRVAAGAEGLPPLQHIPRSQELPLSFSQERLWFLDQLQPGSPAYNISFALGLSGPLKPDLLEAAFDEVHRRHEALRTVFAAADDRPLQRVLPPQGAGLRTADLSGLPDGRRPAELQRSIVADALRPFDLTAGPLFRIGLLRLSEEEWVLLVSFHHIICDGWSFGIIAREVAEIYAAGLEGRPFRLPAIELHYPDYAHWQRRTLTDQAMQQQIEYWRRQLAHPPLDLKLPSSKPRPSGPDFRGAVFRLEFGAPLCEGLRRLARRRQATLYMCLMAAWKAVLYYYSGQEDILVGSPTAGRRVRQAEGMVGFFINTLVLRTDLSGNPSFEELLDRVRQASLEALSHQDLPFERLVSALRLERDPHRNPLFRVWFVLQNTPVGALSLPGVRVGPVVPETLAVRHDLKLDLTEHGQGLEGFFEYKTSLFDEAEVAGIAQTFEWVLEQAAARPGQSLGELFESLDAHLRERQEKEKEKLKSKAMQRLQTRRKARSEA